MSQSPALVGNRAAPLLGNGGGFQSEQERRYEFGNCSRGIGHRRLRAIHQLEEGIATGGTRVFERKHSAGEASRRERKGEGRSDALSRAPFRKGRERRPRRAKSGVCFGAKV